MTTLGRHQHATVSRLVAWTSSAKPVCFLSGFPGLGKSTVIVPALVDAPSVTPRRVVHLLTPSTMEELFLQLAQELGEAGDDRLASAIDAGEREAKLRAVLLRVLAETPLLLVFDDFHHALSPTDARPHDQVRELLARVARQHPIASRILLITNRRPDRGAWSEPHEFVELQPFEIEEGERVLAERLAEKGLEAEVPPERRTEVVRWCGANPRALGLLAVALASAPLEELVGLAAESWELRARPVAPELVEKLEAELVEKVRAQLPLDSQRLLRALAVFRRPFERAAIESCADGIDVAPARDQLVDSFLVTHTRGWYRLNPVALEVEAAAVQRAPDARVRAHAIAARYYTRHFEAQRLVGGGRRGGDFVEARYHLAQAGDTTTLSMIAARFEAHVRAAIQPSSAPPAEPAALDERIALLLALLEDGGAKGLEYHLARCLAQRGRPGDDQRALTYARRALGPRAPIETWVFCVRLHVQAGQLAQGLADARLGLGTVHADQSVPLYQVASDLLALQGELDDAVALLREGIRVVPPDKNLYVLYQAASNLFARRGELDALETLLDEAHRRIPARSSNRYKVAESVGLALACARDADRIARIAAWTGAEGLDDEQRALFGVLELVARGEWSGAAQRADALRATFPRYLSLATLAAYCHLCAGDPRAAERLLAERAGLRLEGPIAWLAAWIALANGDDAAARARWRAFTADLAADTPTRDQLLGAWAAPMPLTEPHPAYYFPILPASLGGWDQDLVRPLSGAGRTDLGPSTRVTSPSPPARSPEPSPAFTWLHLSDIHFGHGDASTGWDQRLVLDALLDDVETRLRGRAPRPDVVLVTGDIAFSGGGAARGRDEYADAAAWLDRVIATVGCTRRDVYLVAGNHDVERAADGDRDTLRLVEDLRGPPRPGRTLDDSLAHDGDRARLTARQRSYLAFARGFAPACGDLHWRHSRETRDGLRVRLVGLNTALLAKDEHDRGKLRLGNQQLSHGLLPVAPRELVMVLSHHPLRGGWLADEEDAGGWIRRRAHVHLWGHIHRADSEQSRSGSGQEIVHVAAGAAHGDPRDPLAITGHGYSFGAAYLSGEGIEIRVWPRRWSDKNKRFQADADNLPPDAEHAAHRLALAR